MVWVFVSVGFYFLKQPQEIISIPIIVAPTSKEKFEKIPGWDTVLESMEPEEKTQFLGWWRNLPPFSHSFDMQAIVALSFKAGRESAGLK